MSQRIGSKTIDEIIQENTRGEDVVHLSMDNKDIEVIVKPLISYQDRCQMVNDIANMCYDEAGEYHPEFFSIAFQYNLLKYFTNITVEIEDSVNKIHTLCECTNIIHKVASVCNTKALDSDAREIIKWRNQKELYSSAWDSVALSLSSLLDKLADNMEQMENVDQNDAKKFMDSINTLSKMDEEKIVDNILESRDKSVENK